KVDPGYKRATSAQRCVRAGGKHNDLENVGYTARHHTFFEMMGNFSFGDYFKEETISWAWEFSTDVLGLDRNKITVTVHPTDDDSRALWRDKIGVPAERIIDLEENFWTMGDTGPCGPCTELFYDHGPSVAGGPPGSPEEDGDRYIEFWNLVFPQFDRSADGELASLPQAGVDTGMGLERMAAILQGVHSNYEIDLFSKILSSAGEYAGIRDSQEILNTASLRVIADHIRSSAFLIADGIKPGNEDRAYVLRRIIRRALRHGYKLNIREPFFHKLVPVLVAEMGAAYPLLSDQESLISAALADEEARFSETLNQGMELLKRELGQMKGDTLPGDTAFKLYDTYGFPVDLTADVARELGLKVDQQGFDEAMEAQRQRGRAATSFSTTLGQKVHVSEPVEFVGYEQLETSSNVIAVFNAEGDSITQLKAGDAGILVADKTPFYAESGGQVGDVGRIIGDGFEFQVTDTQVSAAQHLHIGVLSSGTLESGVVGVAEVGSVNRDQTRANHSATHLLHAALRQVLGDHVQQKGSLVNAEKLRFDFSHEGGVNREQLAQIEDLVCAQIRENSSVDTQLMAYDDAVAKGAMALFGEKYADEVRVLSMGEGYSVELCGGTHVQRTGDIGAFKIQLETGIAAGVRRIEALTGQAAVDYNRALEDRLLAVSEQLKTNPLELTDRIVQIVNDNKALSKALESLSQKMAVAQSSDLSESMMDINGVVFLAAKIDADSKTVMQTLDTLRSKAPNNSVFVLANVQGGKVGLVVAVSKDLNPGLSAPELLNAVGSLVGAKGGGRPDLARAGGGDNPAGIDALLEQSKSWVVEHLN
ncbi:MAG: alanine--tRNA ligase, partial [Proteobacteria bacterium]|nr:alanine--tRNA ligase [Pseudomonadota bacterium]